MTGRTPLACLVILTALASVLIFGTATASAGYACTDSFNPCTPKIEINVYGPYYGNAGTEAEYQYRVYNAGPYPIDQVVPADSQCTPLSGPASDDNDDGILSSGEYWTYTCKTTLAGSPGDSIEHHATVTGVAHVPIYSVTGTGDEQPTQDVPVDADAHLTTTITDLSVVKSVDKSTADPYDDLNYTITLTNNGPEGVVYQGYLSDEGCGNLSSDSNTTDGPWFSLGPGESAVYTCVHSFNPGSGRGQDANPYVNEACAEASVYWIDEAQAAEYLPSLEVCDSASTSLAQHTVSGVVFEDMNADGARQFDEPALPGVVVYADLNDNGARDEGEPSSTSDGQGNYSLPVELGTTVIREDVPGGMTCSFPNGCAYTVTLPKNTPPQQEQPPLTRRFAKAADPTGKDFGDWRPASVSGTVVNDSNGNGVRDAGEGGLGGITVYADLNGNGDLDAGEPSTTSAGDGSYVLAGFKPGGYGIRQILPGNGTTCTGPAGCSHALTLVSNQSAGDRNFLDAPRADQSLLPERIVRIPGVASLRGRTGCVNGKGFTAVIRGKAMTRFVVFLDGKVMKSVSLPADNRSYRYRVNVAKLSVGRHQLAVRVVFRQLSRTKSKTMRVNFQRCAAQLRAPAFTG